MTQYDDAQLATWLAEGPAHGQPAALERALSAAHATRQRPAWLVAASGGTIAAERTNRSVGLAWGLVAVVALTGLLIGGLVVGGWLRPQPAPDAVLPTTAAWIDAGQMNDERLAHTATALTDGRVLVAGGVGDPPKGSAELYDPVSGAWTSTGNLITGRWEFAATLLADGTVLAAGGFGIADTRLASAELYDPATESWTAATNMGVARRGPTATLLPDGTVLVAGGEDAASAEVYDPVSGTWTATGPMVEARAYHTATLLLDGTVLVTGGGEGDGARSAEVYDPGTRTWTATGSMIEGRAEFITALLPNGKVLVAGGDDGDGGAELYDPEIGTWTATRPMIDDRHQHRAAVLPDGTVLVTGGGTFDEADELINLASAELYDPETETWAATASMETGHRYHTATVLPDGTVLVAGGAGDTLETESTAERYGHDSDTPGPEPSRSAEASALPAGQGLIAYTAIEALEPGVDCTDSFASVSCFRPRLWVSNADGTDAHELFPNRPGRQIAVAWSPDGSRLLFSEDSPALVGLMLTDAAGSEPQLVIDATCEDLTCSDFGGATFSPDGTQIAFRRVFESGSLIATMDLSTGSVVELESTRTTDEPSNGAPRWSPDGGRLIFDRQATGIAGARETNLFVVNADGSGLRRLTPNELFAIDPDWSPDGSSIVFLSSVPSNGEGEPDANDIYAIGSDGTGVRRLTTDGISIRPNWTEDGRIVFVRVPTDAEGVITAFELWVMNADGTGQTQLDADDLAELSDANCVICPYPPMDFDAEVQFLNDALWQPTN